MQLYFDFSGYSDMAVGVGLLMGLRLPQNFNSPYKSASVSEFWRRWHITLSFWMRDYLFISLGGSRGGRWRTVRNLMITMTLAGLWHGSGWTYVLWGAVWGLYLSVHSLLRRRGAERGPAAPWLRAFKRGATFLLVIVAWVPFRAPSMAVTGRVLGAMIGLHGVDSWKSLTTLVGWRLAAMLGAALVFVNAAPNTWEVTLQPRKRYALAIGLAMGASILMISHPLPFLYLQF
jgi:alginate O-acetyltransferase complex protein AlgI